MWTNVWTSDTKWTSDTTIIYIYVDRYFHSLMLYPEKSFEIYLHYILFQYAECLLKDIN